MRSRKLGSSGPLISELGFGCMSLHVCNTENMELLRAAADNGINYFDTADLYDQGENEKLVGQAFKNDRQRILIGTKVGNEWRQDGSGWDWNPSPLYIKKAVEKSLQRLQTDYIDLYQLHGGTMEDPIDEIIDTFESLRTAGKIRFYGISSIRPNVIRAYVKRKGISSVMIQYSLLDRRPEESCLDLLASNQVGVLARGVLAKGLLAGKAAEPFLNLNEEQISDFVHAVAGKESLSTIALGYALHHRAVSSAVIGIRTLQQLQNLLSDYLLSELSAHKIQQLQCQAPKLTYTEHR